MSPTNPYLEESIFLFKSQFSSVINLRIQFLDTLDTSWLLLHNCIYPTPKEKQKNNNKKNRVKLYACELARFLQPFFKQQTH